MQKTGEHLAGTDGEEWLVDAFGCEPARLRSVDGLRAIFSAAVQDLGLHPIGEPHFHAFPGEGGVTGLLMLSESHLTCHTFPETGYAAFNLYCCRPRQTWPWEEKLREALSASRVTVRRVGRPAGDEAA